MKNLKKSKLLIAGLFLCSGLLITEVCNAQINITVNATASNVSSSCTDCSGLICVGGAADPYWNVEVVPSGGEHSDGILGSNNGGGGGNGSDEITPDITFYCPGGNLAVRGRACEDDDFLGCSASLLADCISAWDTDNIPINGPVNSSGTLTPNSNGSSATINYTLNASGNFAPNNQPGNQNTSCATAWTLTTNATGTVANDHSTDCGEPVWYEYTLTTSGLASIKFDPDAATFGNGAAVADVKFVDCVGSCSLPDGSGIFSDGYSVENPEVGKYYVAIESDIQITRPYEFDLEVTHEAGTAGPANDDLCNAQDLGVLTRGGTISITSNNYNATSEDFCQLNEPNADPDDETVWFKFTTGADVGAGAYVDASAIEGTGQGGTVCTGILVFAKTKVYKANVSLSCPFSVDANGFGGIDEVGSTGLDASDIDVYCIEPNSTYYVQVQMQSVSTCNTAEFTLEIQGDNVQVGADQLCQATNLGTLQPGESLFIDNITDRCATEQANEPNVDGDDETIWVKFKTSNAAGLELRIDGTAEAGYGGALCTDLTAFAKTEVYLQIIPPPLGPCNFTNLLNIPLILDGDPLDPSEVVIQCPVKNATYYVQLQDNFFSTCDFADYSLTITDKQIVFTPVDGIVCTTDPPINLVDLLQGAPTGQGRFEGPGVDGDFFVPADAGPGNHRIRFIYNDEGCSRFAATFINTEVCVGITENSFLSGISSYPNPFDERTTLNFNLKKNADLQIDLFDVNGKMMKSILSETLPIGNHTVEIDGADLAIGTYFVSFRSNNEAIYEKLVIMR